MIPVLLPFAADAARAIELMHDARYAEAVVEARAESDPLLRAETLARVHAAAGDLTGTLAVAREGLAVDPDHLPLLWWVASCGAWARDAELLASASARLRDAYEAAPEDDQPTWRADVERLEGEARVLSATREAALGAERRAKWTACGALGIAVLALVMLTGRPR